MLAALYKHVKDEQECGMEAGGAGSKPLGTTSKQQLITIVAYSVIGHYYCAVRFIDHITLVGFSES